MVLDTLSLLVDSAAQARAHQAAILGPHDEAITYRQLRELCEELRTWLAEHGIAGDDVVALALPNGPMLAAMAVATMCTATCAPLNPVSAAPEVAHALRDLGARALVVRKGHPTRAADVAASRGIPIIELPDVPVVGAIEGASWLGPEATPAVSRTPTPGDVALRLHTSGTTGAPKQVPLSHANLCAAVHEVVRSLQLTSADRCLNVMPLFHSHGLLGALLSTLAAEASIYCAPGLDPRRFLAWASSVGATWYTAAPTVHRAVLAAPGDHAGFRLMRSASAPLPPSLIEALEARFEAPLIEVYGMTEAYQIAANPLPPGERRRGTVGLPTGTEVALLTDDGIAPLGAGEIVLRGPNVFAGYSSPPGANDAAFVDGWFRTGDLGAVDDSGYLSITGRLKEQINRGGEKIAPREVDDALASHPGVRDALTFSIPDPALGEEVAAAVVRTDESLDSRALRRYLAERLAPFKVPKHFVFLTEIPLGPGGKPSRAALANLYRDLSASIPREAAGAAPEDTSTTVQQMAQLWASVLETGLAPTPDDHFFDLGGTSLDVMELVTRIELVFGVDLPIDDVLELPTLQGMADEVDRHLAGDPGLAQHHLRIMRDGTTDVVVVLVPGAHGMAIGLQAIAENVAPGPMVLGFRYPGQVAGQRPLRSIEALSEALLAELDRMQVGQAVLFGNSLGSWVVFETARRLSAAGRPPQGLILGDMYSPRLSRRTDADGSPLRRAVAAGRALARRWRKRAEARRALAEQRHDAVFKASNEALSAYRGGPYQGDIELLTTSLRASRLQQPTYGWDELVDGEIHVHPVPGEHEDLHLLHAPLIAGRISAHLR